MYLSNKALFASLATLSLSAIAQAQQSIPSVIVTVENVQPSRGVFLTPPWIGIHDGTFDTYDGGQPASVPLGGNEIEALAEDGNNGPITATFESLLPMAPQVQGVAGPFGPLAPGDRVSVTLNVNPDLDRYFSYASMIIPSNDAFIANGNPLAHQLFDANNDFIGQSFIVSGDETNDAGTEANDEIASNVAFLAQAAPNTGTTEALPVTTPSPGFAAPGTLSYPDGILNYPVFGNGDFNDADDRIFKVSFRFVDLGDKLGFGADLTNEAEIVADVINVGSQGFALARAIDGERLGILAVGMNLSSPLTAAHLHLGAEGVNGPVIADLSSTIVGNRARDLVDAADLVGPLAGADFVDFLNEVVAGNVYVNLHTMQNPAGEIRGQLILE